MIQNQKLIHIGQIHGIDDMILKCDIEQIQKVINVQKEIYDLLNKYVENGFTQLFYEGLYKEIPIMPNKALQCRLLACLYGNPSDLSLEKRIVIEKKLEQIPSEDINFLAGAGLIINLENKINIFPAETNKYCSKMNHLLKKNAQVASDLNQKYPTIEEKLFDQKNFQLAKKKRIDMKIYKKHWDIIDSISNVNSQRRYSTLEIISKYADFEKPILLVFGLGHDFSQEVIKWNQLNQDRNYDLEKITPENCL